MRYPCNETLNPKCAQIPESKPWLADFAWGDEDEVDVDKLLGSVQVHTHSYASTSNL